MVNKKLKIEKGVPIPSKSSYPFDAMEVKNSFIAGRYSPELARRITAAIAYYIKKHPEKRFTARKVDNHLRVWRTK